MFSWANIWGGGIFRKSPSLYLDCGWLCSLKKMEIRSRTHQEIRWKVMRHPPAPHCSNFNQLSEKQIIRLKLAEIWIWQGRFEWQGAATWMTQDVRFHPDITPSNSHLSFPAQAFQVKIDLNWNLTKVKANQIEATLFQTEIWNVLFPIIWLCWPYWQRQVHRFQKSLIHLTFISTLYESH